MAGSDDMRDTYYQIYEELDENNYNANPSWLERKAAQVYNSTIGAAEWIWESLQGDWNDNRTVGQIAADAAFSMIPLIDQILDVRDLSANCKKLTDDTSDKWAWIGLCLCLIGLIPTVGSAAKGVLKIIIVYIKRVGDILGGQAGLRVVKDIVNTVVDNAMEVVYMFLKDEKVSKILRFLKIYDISGALKVAARGIRNGAAKANAAELTAAFRKIIAEFDGIIIKLDWILSNRQIEVLRAKHRMLLNICAIMGSYIGDCLRPIKELLETVAARIDAHAARLNVNAVTDTKNTEVLDSHLFTRADMPNYENAAHNAATHERHLDDLRSKMEKPIVDDPELQETMDGIYRDGATVGNGSTAAAVREELKTGKPVKGVFHSQKAQDRANELKKWLKKNPNASADDRAAAENVLRDLESVLKGK